MSQNQTQYQQEAFEKLSKLKVGALFMEMGTGKTKVALDLINSKLHKVDYVLWVCPYSAKNEIERERLRWYPNIEMDIVGVESISKSDRIYLETLKKVTDNTTFMVVDESLKIKNHRAKRTERVIKIGCEAEYKLILNGTPLSKNVLDIYTQMDFLSPKILNMPYWQFKDMYCEYYTRGNLKGMVRGQRNIEHLVSIIKPYIFECKLEIDASKKYHDFYYPLVDEQGYEGIKEKFFEECYDDDLNFYALSTQLQRHYCRGKTELLNRVIELINAPVIVFVKYLEGIPSGARAVTGDVPLEKRQEIIEDFRRNGGVLYLTYGTGSMSLNLQFCKNIIFAEHLFDYAQRIQAEDRIYRIGQESDVHYYNLWCNCGLEDMISTSQHKKSNLLDEIKKEIKKAGTKNWLKNI